MKVILSFILATICLYAGDHNRYRLINEASYVCGAICLAIGFFEFFSLHKVPDIVNMMPGLNEAWVSFIEDFQTLEKGEKFMFFLTLLETNVFFAGIKDVERHPEYYNIKSDPAIFFGFAYAFVHPVFPLIMWREGHYTINIVCIFLTVVGVMAGHKFLRQLIIIKKEYEIL